MLVDWLKRFCTFAAFFVTGCCAAGLDANRFSASGGFTLGDCMALGLTAGDCMALGFRAGPCAGWPSVSLGSGSGGGLRSLCPKAECCVLDARAKAAAAQKSSVNPMREREGFMRSPVCVAVFSHPMRRSATQLWCRLTGDGFNEFAGWPPASPPQSDWAAPCVDVGSHSKCLHTFTPTVAHRR